MKEPQKILPQQSDSTNSNQKNKIVIPSLSNRFCASFIDGFILKILFYIIAYISISIINVLGFNESILFIVAILSFVYYCYYLFQLCGKKKATLGQSYSKYRMLDYPTGKPATNLQIWLWTTYKFIPNVFFLFSNQWGWALIILLGLPVFIKPYRRTVYDRLAGVVMLDNRSIIYKK
jgi:uncharacterized RDD family membrane protein YckC